MTRAEEAAKRAYPDNEVLFFAQDEDGKNHPVTTFGREINGFIFGYEQAEKDILKIVSQITADLWGAPCNYSPLDEEICLCPNTRCDEICGTPEASDARCWEMYFNLKIEELNKKV